MWCLPSFTASPLRSCWCIVHVLVLNYYCKGFMILDHIVQLCSENTNWNAFTINYLSLFKMSFPAVSTLNIFHPCVTHIPQCRVVPVDICAVFSLLECALVGIYREGITLGCIVLTRCWMIIWKLILNHTELMTHGWQVGILLMPYHVFGTAFIDFLVSYQHWTQWIKTTEMTYLFTVTDTAEHQGLLFIICCV